MRNTAATAAQSHQQLRPVFANARVSRRQVVAKPHLLLRVSATGLANATQVVIGRVHEGAKGAQGAMAAFA